MNERAETIDGESVSDISPELRQVLEQEQFEAEVAAIMDAALEEGFALSREEIEDFLKGDATSEKSKKESKK